MSRYIILFSLLINFHAFGQSPASSPAEIYPELFPRIQMKQVFADGKTFVDMVPKANPEEINQQYLKQKDQKGFDLKAFAEKYFELPLHHQTQYQSDIQKGILKHIDTLWSVLQREPEMARPGSSLLTLPAPYIVPGGRFREIYYWDSYFTMLGLRYSKQKEMVAHMVNNFAFLIRNYGFIPNGNRSYYLTRSQPPFFSLMVNLLAADVGDKVYLNYRDALEMEYQFWMKGADTISPGQAVARVVKLPEGEILNRYWDNSDMPRAESYREDVLEAEQSKQPKKEFYRNIRAAAESGWDFSSRWFADGAHLSTIITTELIPVDLNGLLYNLEKTLAKAYHAEGKTEQENLFLKKAETRKRAILKYCWNKDKAWFTDYNWVAKKPSEEITLAGMSPMYFDFARNGQARRTAKLLQRNFLKSGGLVTTLKNTGQQWDGPNGWAPLQWMAIQGLKNYNKYKLAEEVAERWINLNLKVFNQTGKLMEKYDVENKDAIAGGGEYPLQDGFGWTNGVLLSLMKQYPDVYEE